MGVGWWNRIAPLGAACVLTAAAAAFAAPDDSDIPANFQPATTTFDYVRREVMIPMRDGVTLHTVIVAPKGVASAPILLTHTPYGASARAARRQSPRMAAILPAGEDVFVEGGYIRVFQDVRGKYGSGGVYVNQRPLRGPLNASSTDHATDAWDTIDWLVKNVPESNGRVGMVGTSYDGMLVLMALTDPHPAMKVAVAVNPVVNTWMNDDDFHGGAFRLAGYDYYLSQQGQKGGGEIAWREAHDDYDVFLRAGSADDFARSRGIDQLPFPARMARHPAYDDFWRAQALESILAARPPVTPTLFVAGQWDQEDSYGAIAAWRAVKPDDRLGLHHLVIGPWSHNQAYGDGSALGPIRFDGDTALHFRREVLRPFLDQYLKTDAPKADLPPVLSYETGTNRWLRRETWPVSCAAGCPAAARNLHLQPGGGLAFSPPRTGEAFDEYLSDPAKPTPYRLRPIRPIDADDSSWSRWLVDDQRPFSDRPDVLVYVTPPLTEPLAIAGSPVVNLSASTTGSDADWVVKLIDVYPDEVPSDPPMGGYQLMVSGDIFRGRYREGFDRPRPIRPNAVATYRWSLPHAGHVFLPGHRIMVQVQSSWFPLYDRNPQTFVDNIFFARPADYRKATHRVFHTAEHPSFIELPTTAVDVGGKTPH